MAPLADLVFVTGPLSTNIHLLSSEREVVIIDTEGDASAIAQHVPSNHKVVAIVLTHNHPDHIRCATSLSALLDAPLIHHPLDSFEGSVGTATEGQHLGIGEYAVTLWHTPGHTPGSLCVVANDMSDIWTGDTLFPGGPGATGNRDAFATVMTSVDRLMSALPDSTRVHPGHGPSTTIGEERPRVEEWRARGW